MSVVINNLLDNAFKYSTGGCVSLTLEKGEDKGVEGLNIIVTDQGEGIKKEKHHFVFEPYAGIGMREGGIGLGLSLVNLVMENNKGKKSLTSTVGQGTTVTVFLPCLFTSWGLDSEC